MDSGVLRDLVIIIAGSLILVLFILIGVIGYLFYRQFNRMKNSVNETVQTAKDMSSEVKEAIRSTKTLASMFKGPKAKSESKPPACPTP